MRSATTTKDDGPCRLDFGNIAAVHDNPNALRAVRAGVVDLDPPFSVIAAHEQQKVHSSRNVEGCFALDRYAMEAPAEWPEAFPPG